MGINIGNNNKINKSIIGNNNKIEKDDNKNILIEIIITILTGIIVSGIIYYIGWN